MPPIMTEVRVLRATIPLPKDRSLMSEKSVPPSQFARRDFLKLSSIVVAGLAGGSWPSLAFAGFRTLPKARLSAGFAAAEPEEGELTWLTPAERLLSGDAEFLSRDARVTIRSSSRAAEQNDRSGDAAIDVVFPALGYQPDSYPTYQAWSYRRDRFGQDSSAPVGFRVPIEATQGLQLVFSGSSESDAPNQPAAPDMEAGDSIFVLSLESSSRVAKLQRGIYVVAYGEKGNAVSPNWSVVAITRHGNEITVPDAKFSYVVLSIDYAS